MVEQALVLGIIQGLTEFLPISSSAHLFLWQYFWGENWGFSYDAFLHLGTLLAVIIYFWRDWWNLLKGIFNRDKEQLNLLFILLIGIIPAGVVGYLWGDQIEQYLRRLPVVIISLMVWAVVMNWADIFIEKARQKVDNIAKINWRGSLLIGLAQVLALIPGTSRSGITITAALAQKIDRPAAARFSFFLGAPLIAGAGFLSLLDLLQQDMSVVSPAGMVVGFSASFISGLVAIWFLLKLLTKHSLRLFVVYRLLLGLLLILIAYVI